MHFTEYDTRLAGYAVIVDAQQRILLSWFNGSTRGEPGWSLPGGGVEYQESVEDAIVREAWEETGYRIRLGVPLTTASFTAVEDGRRPYKAVRILYTASVVGGTLGTIEVGGTTDRAAWLEPGRLAAEPHADIVDIGLASWRSRRLSAADDAMTP